MFLFLKAILLLVIFLASRVKSRNGCRQCIGRQFLRFDNFKTQEHAIESFKVSIGQCATGNEYEFEVINLFDCRQPCLTSITLPSGEVKCQTYTGIKECKAWTYGIKVWRYCGNGGIVNFSKGRQCLDYRRVARDDTILSCDKSVDCHGQCDCKQCGCNASW